jgi:hypothetical protein
LCEFGLVIVEKENIVKRLVLLGVAVVVFFLLSDLCSTSGTVIAKEDTGQIKSDVIARLVFYNLTIVIDPPAGGWTIPMAGIHTYPANTTVSIRWWHAPYHLLAHYNINGTIIPFPNGYGYNITMNANYVLTAVYFSYDPIKISIRPLNATVFANNPVTFLANISGGYYGAAIRFYVDNTVAKSYWLDNTPIWNFTESPRPVSPDGKIEWNFTPTSPGVYFVIAHAEDEWPYETQPKMAIITVQGPHSLVGGYSSPIGGYTIVQLLATYFVTAALLAVTLVVFRHKNQRDKRTL